MSSAGMPSTSFELGSLVGLEYMLRLDWQVRPKNTPVSTSPAMDDTPGFHMSFVTQTQLPMLARQPLIDWAISTVLTVVLIFMFPMVTDLENMFMCPREAASWVCQSLLVFVCCQVFTFNYMYKYAYMRVHTCVQVPWDQNGKSAH